MDIAIQLKSIELLVKFLRHDLGEVPVYGYSVQKPRHVFKRGFPLERSSPEREGISSEALRAFLTSLDADQANLAVHGAMVLRHGKVICEAYWKPYREDIPHMLYSMSKSVTGMAVGFAVNEGLLGVDERLVDIFPEYRSEFRQSAVKELTIKHLLTMGSGSRFNEVGTVLDDNWARMFMESAPKFEPGKAFEYNSINSYMLAAVLYKKTGMGLAQYLEPRLFAPLGIEDYYWEICPQGIEKGGWGLSLTLEDSAKLGRLYLQKGEWNGRQLISRQWVEAATRLQVETPTGECKDGYGYQVWMNAASPGAYQFNGAFGQYVVVLPEHDAVVAIYSGSARLFAEGALSALINGIFADAEDSPVPGGLRGAARLRELSESLRVDVEPPAMGLGTEQAAFDAVAGMLDGREYALKSNTCGLFPFILQGVHGNFTYGMHMLRFKRNRRSRRSLEVYFYESNERNMLEVNPDGTFSEAGITIRGEHQLTGTRGLWKYENGKATLCLICSFIETPDTRVILIEAEGDSLRMEMHEKPSVQGATAMLFELVGLSERAYMKKLLPALQRGVPELGALGFSEAVKRLTDPEAKGEMINQNDLED